jgi:hypothetical protein
MTPTPDQRKAALEAVKLWRETLEGLKQSALENNDTATYASSCKNLSIYDTIESALTAPPQVQQDVVEALKAAEHWCEGDDKQLVKQALRLMGVE